MFIQTRGGAGGDATSGDVLVLNTPPANSSLFSRPARISTVVTVPSTDPPVILCPDTTSEVTESFQATMD